VRRNVVVDPKTKVLRLTKAAQVRADAERERIWAPIRERRARAKLGGA
jgi:hypothetical protein